MSKIGLILAAHPLKRKPYDKLRFQRFDGNGVPLYSVIGCEEGACGPFEALSRAFRRHGGRCFYCSKRFKPQPLSKVGPHRDHVFAASRGGKEHLHNLVIACAHCGQCKGSDEIHEFRPRAAKEYLAALEEHITACVKGASGA